MEGREELTSMHSLRDTNFPQPHLAQLFCHLKHPLDPLYEHYIIGGDDSDQIVYDQFWQAQTFTPSIAHKITSIKLQMRRKGLPGTVTISIRETAADKPTGVDKCSGTTDGDTLPDAEPSEWREISLGAGYNLSADTQYAIVIRALDGDVSNYLRPRRDKTSPTYEGGHWLKSDNHGSSWTIRVDSDLMFEEWGEPIAPPAVGMSHAFITG